MLRKFLEKKTKGFKPIAYAVSKLQVLLIAILALLLLRQIADSYLISAAIAIFSLYYLYILVVETRKEVEKREFPFYFAFFFMLLFAVDLSFFLSGFSGVYSVYAFAAPVSIILAVFIVSFLFRRKYCTAKVAMSEKGSAVIEKDFDLLSMTTAGKFVVESEKAILKGKEAKVAVKTTFFGRKPYKIIFGK